MIKYASANTQLNIVIRKLRNKEALDNYILITLREIPETQYGILSHMIAKKMFASLENKTGIIFDRSFAAQMIEKYIKRGDEYLNNMESYYDMHILEEACRYKIKFVKLSQKTSQIKNRRKNR